jgi:hypothetical protein
MKGKTKMNMNILTIKEKEILDDLKTVMQKHGTTMDIYFEKDEPGLVITDQAGFKLTIDDFDYINE